VYEVTTGYFIVSSRYTCPVGEGLKLALRTKVAGFQGGVEIGWSAAYAARDGFSCVTFSGPQSP
jgi:hypothetical protein